MFYFSQLERRGRGGEGVNIYCYYRDIVELNDEGDGCAEVLISTSVG